MRGAPAAPDARWSRDTHNVSDGPHLSQTRNTAEVAAAAVAVVPGVILISQLSLTTYVIR